MHCHPVAAPTWPVARICHNDTHALASRPPPGARSAAGPGNPGGPACGDRITPNGTRVGGLDPRHRDAQARPRARSANSWPDAASPPSPARTARPPRPTCSAPPRAPGWPTRPTGSSPTPTGRTCTTASRRRWGTPREADLAVLETDERVVADLIAAWAVPRCWCCSTSAATSSTATTRSSSSGRDWRDALEARRRRRAGGHRQRRRPAGHLGRRRRPAGCLGRHRRPPGRRTPRCAPTAARCCRATASAALGLPRLRPHPTAVRLRGSTATAIRLPDGTPRRACGSNVPGPVQRRQRRLRPGRRRRAGRRRRDGPASGMRTVTLPGRPLRRSARSATPGHGCCWPRTPPAGPSRCRWPTTDPLRPGDRLGRRRRQRRVAGCGTSTTSNCRPARGRAPGPGPTTWPSGSRYAEVEHTVLVDLDAALRRASTGRPGRRGRHLHPVPAAAQDRQDCDDDREDRAGLPVAARHLRRPRQREGAAKRLRLARASTPSWSSSSPATPLPADGAALPARRRRGQRPDHGRPRAEEGRQPVPGAGRRRGAVRGVRRLPDLRHTRSPSASTTRCVEGLGLLDVTTRRGADAGGRRDPDPLDDAGRLRLAAHRLREPRRLHHGGARRPRWPRWRSASATATTAPRARSRAA